MHSTEPSRLVEVGDQEANSNLPQQSKGEQTALPDNGAIAKVGDRDLEPDGRSKKDAHEPLQ